MRISAAALIGSLIVCGAARTVRASEQTALPAFDVASPQGAIVHSTGLSGEPRWLMIYVSPGCLPCDRLLAALAKWQSTMVTERLIVVVAADAAAAERYAAAQMAATPIKWYADSGGEARRSLGIQQPLALVAVENGRVQWTVSGVLNDPEALEPLVSTWVHR
jgi:hypothetical protein